MMYNKWNVLVRYGEISLKGPRSRYRMESKLIENIQDAISTLGYRLRIVTSHGRIWICCVDSEDIALKIAEKSANVMGIVSVSPSYLIKFENLEDLSLKARDFFRDRIRDKRFAVRVHRVGTHSFTSKDVEKIVGKLLLESGGGKVDLENPEYTAFIEIRDNSAYLFDKIIKGPGGLPIGVEGKVLALISGGIDSPVAAWYAMKRGCEVHMALFNIGGDKHVMGGVMVAKALIDRWAYGYRPKMYIIDMRPIISRIALYAPEEYMVILLRRYMNRLAEYLARKINALAIVTGESLGQVASQTLNNIYVIEEAVTIPILRPLIGFDKDEIVKMARFIGTYEYSIKVPEFCPIGARVTTTRAILDKVKEIENRIGISETEVDELISRAIEIDLRSFSMDSKDILSHSISCKG